ncbi:MAG TPA: hypothetical protein VG963_13915 [Polyangiaceae bacterium]|nr:hypothetical protein [Polyangiaceae bacterium]
MAKRSSFGPMVLVMAALSCSFYVACGDDDVVITGQGGTGGSGGSGGSSGSSGTGAVDAGGGSAGEGNGGTGGTGTAGSAGSAGIAGTGSITDGGTPDSGGDCGSTSNN